jgi:hypothetical protein
MGTNSYNSIYYNGKAIHYGQCLSDGFPDNAGIDFLTEIKMLIEKYGLEEFIRLLKEVEFKKFEHDVKKEGNNDGDKDKDSYTVYLQSSYGCLENIIISKVGYTNADCYGEYNYVLDLDTLTVGLRFHEEDETSLSDIDKLIESWKN